MNHSFRVISPGWLVGALKRPRGWLGSSLWAGGAISALFLPDKKHEFYCQYIAADKT
jgi:hypothetical protein